MERKIRAARWLAVGVSIVALSGAGRAVASTAPPSTPSGGSTAAGAGGAETSTSSTAAAGGGQTSASSSSTGAGPSDCPATLFTPSSSEPSMATGSMAVDTGLATGSMAMDTGMSTASMPADTGMSTASMPSGSVGAGSETSTSSAGSVPMPSGPFVQIAETAEYGPILVDNACRALYIFTNDANGEPSCVDDCAVAWPPLLVPDDSVPPLADELDPSLFSVTSHPQGSMLKVGDWPLYYFAKDTAPGDTNGQGVGGVWWLVGPDGTPMQEGEGATASSMPGSSSMGGDTGASTTTMAMTTSSS